MLEGEIRQTYAAAGVDIERANAVKEVIKKYARSTFTADVLSDIGLFGGLFKLKRYGEPVLVSSVDGVGTKLKIATTMEKHDTIGMDLVYHCVNDIITCGAEPLFFLDYIAMSRLSPKQIEEIVKGLVAACHTIGCPLIGGETAEMPGVYNEGDYDLVGFIVGVVEKEAIIDGSRIEAGDAILGIASSGLHTNGYSLVRQIFPINHDALNVFYPELGRTLGEELLEPHRCYYPLLKPLFHLIKGMAHITGGGLIENIPRILPQDLAAHLNSSSWSIPPIFKLIQEKGNVDKLEMYRVFNMGVGMVIVCSPKDVFVFERLVPGTRVIGKVVEAKGKGRVLID